MRRRHLPAATVVAAFLWLGWLPQGVAEEFRRSPDAAVVRGSIVFKTFCILCHGADGEGDGRAAKIHDPKPANLTLSILTDEQREIIIRTGGASIGRSPVMPAWGEHLTDEQITDVVAYLRKINRRK